MWTYVQLWNRWSFWGGIFLLAISGASGANYPVSPLAVARGGDGRLELFETDRDGTLRCRWQRKPGEDWSAWSALEGSWLPGLAAVTNADGEIEVFAVDRASHALSYTQQKPHTHNWSPWTVLGGAVVPPATVLQNADGRLEVCAVTTNGALQHRFQTEPRGEWSAWEDFGGRLHPGLLCVRHRDHLLELFGVDADSGRLLHRRQREAGTSRDWLPWADLGGTINPAITAAQASDGHLEIFALVNSNGMACRLRQESPGENAPWSSWENFGRQTDFSGCFEEGLAAAENADGRLEVFGVRKSGTEVMHRWQSRTEAGAWTPWISLGGSLRPPLVVGRNQDGNLEIFGLGSQAEREVEHLRQISANTDWLYWTGLDRSPPEYLPRVWQTDEGLPNNRVQALAQTSDGYLWVGTHEGLARFDGMQFSTLEDPKLPELAKASITTLCAESSDTLWIGTEGGAVLRWRRGELSAFPTQDGVNRRSVYFIYRQRNRAVWIASKIGLERFLDGQYQMYTTRQGLLSDMVKTVCEDSDGNVWIGSTNGLNCLRGGQMEAFTIINGLPHDAVRSLCLDRGRRVWIGSDHGLVAYGAKGNGRNRPDPLDIEDRLIRYQTGRFYSYTSTHGLSDNFVSAIFEDSRSNLWVGTSSGLNRFIDGHFRAEPNKGDLPYDQINTIFEDNTGNVWVGSREGLIRLSSKPFSVYTKREGLSHNNVKSVLQDHHGRLWVGTWGGGLDEITGDSIRVFGTTNHFGSDLILALCEDRDGGIWVGADNRGGLSYIKNQEVAHYTSQDNLPKAAITVLFQDRTGVLWVGTARELGRWQNGRYVRESQWGNQRLWAMAEDGEGSLWFGGDSGVMRKHGETFEDLAAKGVLPSETVYSLLADADGKTVWIGTRNGGLLRWRDHRLDRYTTAQGLLSNEIMGLIEDHGWLWMTSTKGIFRVRKQDLETPGAVMPCVTYGIADGLESIVCGGMASPSIWKTADGRLCFTTTKGLAVIDSRNTRMELSRPLVHLENFDIDRKPMALPTAGELIVPPNHGELEFRYTALDFRAPDRCRFKYKLEDVDSDWIDAGTRRVAHYSSIGPGRYRFQVAACNKDGVWNAQGASISLWLRPHLWQTWWFRTLAVAALVGVIAGLARFLIMQKLRQKMALLEMQHSLEKERTRISRDIHDDLGATLTQITLLSDLAQREASQPQQVNLYAAQISQTARELVQAMDEIVWAVNPCNDSLPRVTGYIFQHAEKFFAGTAVRCRFDGPEQWPDVALSAETRHHLFLAAKEALTNVARHSGATEAWVRWKLSDGELQLSIEDNGKGLKDGPRAQFGNGLANMKKRMEEIGGKLELTTTPGAGTIIRLRLPLKG